MKAIIFDSSTLISLSMNGLLNEVENLKKIFDGKFLITEYVKQEIIDTPIKIKRFELEALRLKELLNKRIIELSDSLGISRDKILKKTEEIMNVANSTFQKSGGNIRLIDLGEASCLALSRMLDEKKIKNVIAVDERTLRMLGEKPENLAKLLEKKLHIKINSRKENFKFFTGFNFIRSSELLYVAYKKNIASLKNGLVLDALLYAVKFKGCSISHEEIEEIKRLR